MSSVFSTVLATQEWDRVAKLSPGDHILVVQDKGQVVEGAFRAWSPEAVTLESRKQVQTLPQSSLKQVSVKRKASRWKAVGIGAGVGFAIGFPIGAASAGYLADQNNPRVGTRAGFGAGFGLFGAGIGAGLGALAGGSRYETLYRRK